jgi:hypothetical protein
MPRSSISQPTCSTHPAGSDAVAIGGGADVPSSTAKTLVERYTVSADGRTLFYDYTMNDPAYLSAPYSHRVEFMRMPSDTPMYPYTCDPESAAMFSRDAEEIR